MKLIPLTQGRFAQVDDEDYEYLNQWKWHVMKNRNTFYAARNIDVNDKRKTQLMHRLILGDDPLKLQIDHKDGDGLNNQKLNLRFCTPTENLMNAKIRINGSSKYKGVCWDKQRQKWKTSIQVDGVLRYLGRFDDEIDAALAYDISAIKLFGEFARINID